MRRLDRNRGGRESQPCRFAQGMILQQQTVQGTGDESVSRSGHVPHGIRGERRQHCDSAGLVNRDALRAARAKATVFAGGKWLQSHPERAQQLIADPLLELASHGWAHRNVRGLADAALAQEIRGPEAAFQSQRAALLARQCAAAVPGAAGRIQPSLTLYRFPFGACHAGSLRAVADAGMLAVQWDISTGDSSASETAAAITRSIVDRARPGSIILAHGNGRGHHTAQALPEAIRQLRVKGFELVTVSELLAAGKPVIAETCYDSRPGDTDRYDKLFAPRPPRPDKSDAIPPRPLPR